MSEEFREIGWCAYRNVKRFAALPVKTLDAGVIWGREYWMHERHWGWGFQDRFCYANGLPDDLKNLEAQPSADVPSHEEDNDSAPAFRM